MGFIMFIGSFIWLLSGFLLTIGCLSEPKKFYKLGLTRGEVILCVLTLPVSFWYLLIKIDRYDRQVIRKIEEERINRLLEGEL